MPILDGTALPGRRTPAPKPRFRNVNVTVMRDGPTPQSLRSEASVLGRRGQL